MWLAKQPPLTHSHLREGPFTKQFLPLYMDQYTFVLKSETAPLEGSILIGVFRKISSTRSSSTQF